jgi:hypothetical protein
MFHTFHLDVACVLSGYSICCNGYTRMLQVFVSNVSSVSDILQVFYLDVAYFSVAIHIYCKHLFKIFHLFQTYVVNVLFECCICYSCYIHMLQA